MLHARKEYGQSMEFVLVCSCALTYLKQLARATPHASSSPSHYWPEFVPARRQEAYSPSRHHHILLSFLYPSAQFRCRSRAIERSFLIRVPCVKNDNYAARTRLLRGASNLSYMFQPQPSSNFVVLARMDKQEIASVLSCPASQSSLAGRAHPIALSDARQG